MPFSKHCNQTASGLTTANQRHSEKIGQYATRLACYISNHKELKENYEIRAEETLRQGGECTYCVHVGSLIPVPSMHASEVLVYIISFRIPLIEFLGSYGFDAGAVLDDVGRVQQHAPAEGKKA